MDRISSPLALAYSILAGPIIWFVHFIIVYTITEFGCRANFTNWVFISPATIQLVIIVATIVSLVAVAFAGFLAYRQRRAVEVDSRSEISSETKLPFLAMLGILFSALFLFSIVMTAVPTVILPPCDLAT